MARHSKPVDELLAGTDGWSSFSDKFAGVSDGLREAWTWTITGPAAPAVFMVLFMAASILMIWRLGVLERRGFEGTILGTLVTPYCSGFPNLVFAYVVAHSGKKGLPVLENCIVNNATNLTLLIGIPALVWGLSLQGAKTKGGGQKSKAGAVVWQLNRLSLMLTITAIVFFTAGVWAMVAYDKKDHVISRGDGAVLIGIFVFWQVFHVFDVLKQGVRDKRSPGWIIVLDFLIIAAGAVGVYLSVDAIVLWIEGLGSGFFGTAGLGWLSGWLMALPNATLALYYTRAGRGDIAYSSLVGDGHICIPLCIGIFAVFKPISIPPNLQCFYIGLIIIVAAAVIHFICVAVLGRLPRWMGAVLVLAYGYFLMSGLSSFV